MREQIALFGGPPAPAAPPAPDDLERFASISHDKRYRFALMRAWVPDAKRYVMFVGLNPSTADAKVEDPTLRRCIGFARAWGFDGLWMGNLFAYRATDPADLPADLDDAVGPQNVDPWLREMRAQSELCVAAWGAHPMAQRRAAAVSAMLGDVACLGVTKDGHPRHPLYLPASAERVPYLQGAAA